MKTKEFESINNNKIRSFLSPYNKSGTRSLSTSDSCPQINVPRQIQKTYIDFRRINREKTQKVNLQIRLNDFNKKEKKDIKLYKYTINKHKQQNQMQEKFEDNCDLLKMVRSLKERIMKLQIQNSMFLQKQQQDAIKIAKQQQIIKNLEQALSLNRSRHSYSFEIFQNQKKINQNNYEHYKTQKNFKHKKQLQQKFIEIKLEKLQQEYMKLKQNFQSIMEQNNRLKHFKNIETKDSSFTHPSHENTQLLDFKSLEKALKQIEVKKLKQLSQIDMLLFGSGF